jgi:predicted nucleotide-binding protein
MESPVDLVKELIKEGEGFTFQSFCYENRSNAEFGKEWGGESRPEWVAWTTRSVNLIYQVTAAGSPAWTLANEGRKITTNGNFQEDFERAKSVFLTALRMTLDALKEDRYGELIGPKSTSGSPALSNKVFVVHGHDQALKAEVEVLLTEIGLEPVVLHRQPDKGQTVIEKFEEHADVGYAFILLTPDDVAYPKDREPLRDASRNKELRARQNVIFEFGYFAGRLGRDRVCCLYKEGVVLPSDLAGLIYKKVTDSVESQAYAIVKDLRAAGYQVKF